MLLDLVQNIALLVALAVGLQALAQRLAAQPMAHHIAAGLLFGFVGIVGMMTPLHFAPGVIYDGRSIILSLAGLFGGPVTAGISALICGAYRLHLGGAGVWAGVGTIVEAALLGTALHYLRRRDERWVSATRLLLFGILVHAIMLALQLLIAGGVGWTVLREIGPTVLFFYPLAFVLIAQVFLEAERRRAAERGLRESEALQLAMVACSPVALYSIDLNGNVQTWNASAEKVFGWTADEVLGKPLPVIPDNKEQEFGVHLAALKEGRGFKGREVTRLRKDGSTFYGSLSTAAVRGASGQIIGIMGAMEDITESKLAEQALEERERYLRAVLQTSADGFWVLDRHAVLMDVNDAYCAMTGYSRDELIGMRIGDLDIDEEPVKTQERMRRVIKNGSELFEARHRRKDGTVFPIEVSSTYMHDGEGRFICFGRDLTIRLEAEERMAMLAEMLDTAPSSITVHDTDGRFLYANRKTFVLHGYGEREFMDINLHDLDVPESEALIEERFNQIKSTGEASFEVSHYRKDGTTFPLAILAKLISWRGKRAILSVARDISERKQAEQERRRLEEELSQAQKLESVGRLAGGVAHDFNNMLNVILGHVDLLMEDLPGASPLRKDLEEVRSAALRSANLTRQLLAFARRQTVAPKVIDVNETIGSMLKMLGRLIGEDIRLVWRPGNALAPIHMDPAQIDQLLANLVVNARDAIGHSGGTVVIETAQTEVSDRFCAARPDAVPGRYVVLTVTDDGSGMDAETRAQIFEPFFTTKDVGKGTGLGLATVYGIVRQNGGFVDVESEPRQGTTFRLYLPAYGMKPAESAPEKASAEEPQRGHETVLLVEDESAILTLGKRILGRLGYRVLAASTPVEAIHLAEQYAGEIHLLITDVVMPEMNGRELAKRLLSLYPGMKRLFMSGYTADVIAHQGVLDEGVNFLQKPFSHHTLSEKVREILDT